MGAIITTHHIKDNIENQGYSLVPASDIPLTPELEHAWADLRTDYETLPADEYLPEKRNYRFRRYDRFRFSPATGQLSLLPHETYFQETDINEVTGGIVRQFAPLLPKTVNNSFLHALIRYDFAQFPLRSAEQQFGTWQVDVHEILVRAEPNSNAHPTPEGIHRDGAEFVTVHLAVLDNADGGFVTVYDDEKQPLESFRLNNILDSYLFDDARLWHGVTPIVSADGIKPAMRGILTFDYHYKPDLQ